MFGLKWRPSWFFSKWRTARGRPSWRPSKIETVCHRGHMGQIWCFWKNLNQKSLSSLTIVNHAVFTMFQFLCLDNGNNVAARRVGHLHQWRRTSNPWSHVLYRYPQTKTHDSLQNSIVVICSDVEVLVLSVVVLFAANMSVIIMSLEFGRRPKKVLKVWH